MTIRSECLWDEMYTHKKEADPVWNLLRSKEPRTERTIIIFKLYKQHILSAFSSLTVMQKHFCLWLQCLLPAYDTMARCPSLSETKRKRIKLVCPGKKQTNPKNTFSIMIGSTIWTFETALIKWTIHPVNGHFRGHRWDITSWNLVVNQNY